MDYNYSSDSDSSEDFFSQDEILKKYIFKKQKEKEDEYNKQVENRQRKFEKAANEKNATIFNLQGVNIMRFTSTRIKFCYQPSLLYHHISKKIVFYCSMRYLERYKKWLISREPMPARPLYFNVTHGKILIEDNAIENIVIKIYEKLRKWSEEEIRYRRSKYEKYRAGNLSYLDIDSTDEELYFSDNERRALFEKRQAVLRRMIPPKTTEVSRPKRRPNLKYLI